MARPSNTHPGEQHNASFSSRLNWLRAAVLGANDGIVSTASLVIGVAGAGSSHSAIVTAGLAGLFAGSLSMATGEFVSVSSQRDSERAQLDLERFELANEPERELAELARIYEGKGLTEVLAQQVAAQLTNSGALSAHADAELRIDPEELTNPWHAAGASALAFLAGATLPLLSIAIAPSAFRVIVTVVAVVAALVLTGLLSASLGHAGRLRPTVRNVCGGLLAMGLTYGIGAIIGTTVG